MAQKSLKIRKVLADQETSKAAKYQALVIGKPGLLALISYELIILLCSGMPGALGLLLRSKLYPLLLGGVGKNVTFGSNITLRHPHKIYIGDNVVIDDNCLLDAKGSSNAGIFIGDNVFLGRNTILSCKNGDIRLGNGVNIGFNCEIFSGSSVTLAENVLVAAYCYLVGSGDYDLSRSPVSFAEQDAPPSAGIIVKRNVWLGAKVTVLDGVTIGEQVVVAAGAVVRGDIPAWSIAAGLPAKVIRKREELQPV